jgi:outer membrane autotransporter protein
MFQVPASEYTGVLDELYDAQAGELALINSNAARDFIDSIVDRLGGLSQSGGMSLGSLMVNPVQIGTGLMANAVPGASQGNAPLDPHFWASGFGSWTNTKTTISGPGFTTGNGGVALGYDTQVDSNWTLGLAGSYTAKSTVNFEPFGISPVGDRGTYTGFEVGPYARYDSDQGFYLTGAAAYGNFNDRTMRFVTLPNPTPPPTDLSGVVSGKFTTNTWSVYGEGGVPLNTGMGFKMTPFVAVSYIQTDSGAYTETGTLTGGTMPVNLHVSDASATSIETYLGAEFAGTWDMGDTQLLPSLKVAWAHEFDSDIWQVDSYFAAVGPTSAFTVTGSALAKDFAVVDASLGLALQDNLSATLSYEGRYSDSSVSHLVMGKLQLSVP